MDDYNHNWIDLLRHAPFYQFIEYVSAQRHRYHTAPTFGHYVQLPAAKRRIANDLNRVYSRLLWGVLNNPFNDRPRADERAIIRRLRGTVSDRRRILEIGAGSGRLTPSLTDFGGTVIALERELEMLSHLRAAMSTNSPVVRILAADAAVPVLRPGTCSAVVLLENMLGMTLLKDERLRILRTVWRYVRHGGALVCGFRVSSHARGGKLYQALPYQVHLRHRQPTKLYGIAINWSNKAFIAEVRKVVGAARLAVVEGSRRPAGGRMHYLIAHKAERIGR